MTIIICYTIVVSVCYGYFRLYPICFSFVYVCRTVILLLSFLWVVRDSNSRTLAQVRLFDHHSSLLCCSKETIFNKNEIKIIHLGISLTVPFNVAFSWTHISASNLRLKPAQNIIFFSCEIWGLVCMLLSCLKNVLFRTNEAVSKPSPSLTSV